MKHRVVYTGITRGKKLVVLIGHPVQDEVKLVGLRTFASEYHFDSRLHPGLHAVPVLLLPVHFRVAVRLARLISGMTNRRASSRVGSPLRTPSPPSPLKYLQGVCNPRNCVPWRRGMTLPCSQSGNGNGGCMACCGAGGRFSGAQSSLAALS